MARLLGKMESTACEYLCCYIHEQRPDDIDAWVDRATQERITTAARQHGTRRLKPIYLALNQEVPYDAIRVVLTYLNTRTDLTESFGAARKVPIRVHRRGRLTRLG